MPRTARAARWGAVLFGARVATAVAAAAVAPGSEQVVGGVRVQALSPTLLRVEPHGPRGFEDRPTFMVVERTSWGIPLRVQQENSSETLLATTHYLVLVRRQPASFAVLSVAGAVLYDSALPGSAPSPLLHWPSPLSAAAYALEDRPRFVVPPWTLGPVPPEAKVDPELRATHGYDFRNDVGGDTYVFLLGDTLPEWKRSRGDFLKLTGPTPLLPSYAYGTWFTQWAQYSESQAKSEVQQWEAGRFPLDVWGLDMNWREVGPREMCMHQDGDHPQCLDHFYNYSNAKLFPDFPEWFRWLKARGLRTYFNDHPFPQDVQTASKEVEFRWQGLTSWISKGLDYWWFDHNWGFTVPPPMKPKNDGSAWEDLTSQVWGSHLYYEITKQALTTRGEKEPPLALSRDNGPFGFRAGMPATKVAAVAAHHRYPVWWTGDGVLLNASVETMVDQGMHDFRAFTHSDCGGHQPNASSPHASDALLRWTAHCVFGTILRFHQGEHRFWLYTNSTQDIVRKYLEARYRLVPSLISAGSELQLQGFPLVARCDFFWPEHPEARNNTQYVHLNDTLVAPLGEEADTRDVWIPPGQWQDAWSGSILTGPQTIRVTQPPSRIPMWHRRGGVLITAGSPGLRVAEQDWSNLTIEAFPAADAAVSHRRLDLGPGHRLEVELSTPSPDRVRLIIRADEEGTAHAWVLRLHMLPGQRVEAVALDGEGPGAGVARHLLAGTNCAEEHFPFGGPGSRPACGAGAVAEVHISASSARRAVDVRIGAAEGPRVFV